ncbi:MAG: hypothetical protein IJ401_05200, partial [Oscillospiraceae bacterium]|nr:hypothetical protein [Oscillospiraceae bacterium]
CLAKYPTSFASGLLTAADQLNKIPTADVAEVKHGHWIYEEDVIGDTDTGQYRCSNCRAGDIHLKKIDIPFCWKCGAKMDGAPKERGGEK